MVRCTATRTLYMNGTIRFDWKLCEAATCKPLTGSGTGSDLKKGLAVPDTNASVNACISR